jgi:hypothetical protein
MSEEQHSLPTKRAASDEDESDLDDEQLDGSEAPGGLTFIQSLVLFFLSFRG